MEDCVCFGGMLTRPIKFENGIKQGDLLAPTLLSIYFAIELLDASADCHDGIGQLANFSMYVGLQQGQVFFSVVQNLLYGDDCDLVAHTIQHAQEFMD